MNALNSKSCSVHDCPLVDLFFSSPYSSSRSLSSQRSLGSSPVSALGYTPGIFLNFPTWKIIHCFWSYLLN